MKKNYTLGILLVCACLFATQIKAQNSITNGKNETAKSCNPVASVECVQVYNDVSITWNAPSSDIDYYNIYKNGELLDSSSDTEYTDAEPGAELFEYCIEAIYNNGCVAEQTCQDIEITYFEPETPIIIGVGACPEPHFHLYWDHPDCNSNNGEGEWIQYDSGECTQGIGGSESFTVAVRWDDMMEFDKFAVSKVKLHISWAGAIGDRATIILKIWEGENAATEVMSKDITNEYTLGWSEFELETPHTIDGSKELWIGYEVVDGGFGYPASLDQSVPSATGYGNMTKLEEEEWEPLNNYGLEGNWNIQANIVDRSGFIEYLVYNNSTNQLVNVTQECEYIYYDPFDCFYVIASYFEGLSEPSEHACLEFDPPANIQCSQVESSASITWDAPSDEIYIYKISRDGITIGSTAETEYTDIEPGFGVFEYCVSAVYNIGYETEAVCCEVEIIETVVITSPESFILNEEYTSPQGDYFLIFEWEHPQCSKEISEIEFQRFEVFFQDENMNEPILMSTTNQCIDTLLANDYHEAGDCFWVEAVYNDGRATSDEYCLTTGVGETETKFISIYPNPASNIFYIESNEILESIYIYNLIGQEVFKSEVASKGVFEINCASFDSGVYLVKIETENRSSVERITIR